MKEQDVSSADIPGDFLQTEYEKWYIYIKMEETMVNLLGEIDLAYYKDFISRDSGKNNSCMQKAMRLYTSL